MRSFFSLRLLKSPSKITNLNGNLNASMELKANMVSYGMYFFLLDLHFQTMKYCTEITYQACRCFPNYVYASLL